MPDTPLSNWPWYSPNWFLPKILLDFEWEFNWVLFLLIAIPILILLRWLISIGFRERLAVAFKGSELRNSPVALLRFIPPAIMMLALTLLVVAAARPQLTNERVEQYSEGIDIMLVVDISQSMEIEDFKPNRLEAAKGVAQEFIDGRFQDRIGLVVFSGDAFSLAPLTNDYELLHTYIEQIDFQMINKAGTAIGSALAVGINRMTESESKSKVLILLSDGDNNAGNIDPITAADLAAGYNIKVYTIGIGKEGRVPWGKDIFGRPNYVENRLDETTLRKIAEIGSGEFYRVSDNKKLEEVFRQIDKLEKVEIKENRYQETTDFYEPYLRWGIVLLLLWLLSRTTFVANVLQD